MTKENNNGITLIALVVTIIILLILASTSIKLAFEKGLIDIATKVVENYTKAEEYESSMMENYKNLLTSVVENPTGGNTGEEKMKLASELDAGDLVYYPTIDGTNILCQVLYDKAYNEENGTNYGVQIVALEGVLSMTFSNLDGYNNGINQVAAKVKEYRNAIFTSEGEVRSIGTNPTRNSHTEDCDIDKNRLIELNQDGKCFITSNKPFWYAKRISATRAGGDGHYITDNALYTLTRNESGFELKTAAMVGRMEKYNVIEC